MFILLVVFEYNKHKKVFYALKMIFNCFNLKITNEMPQIEIF